MEYCIHKITRVESYPLWIQDIFFNHFNPNLLAPSKNKQTVQNNMLQICDIFKTLSQRENKLQIETSESYLKVKLKNNITLAIFQIENYYD